ncbi:MAG: 7-cyano-7-deazaguanine synthase QueC [Methanohalobium sp.]|uniref:7-cyano-7-deazaguanine synthase QueC n=1 Tax=Methanohalobium sp. TaxID=2837493 RepID=UPI003979779F
MGAISLLSSGLDSVAALTIAREKTDIKLAIIFDYGQRSAKKEIEYSKKICDDFGINYEIIRLDWLEKITNTSLVSRKQDVPELTLDDVSGKTATEKTEKSAKSVWVPNRNGIFLNIAAGFAESFECEYVVVGFNSEEAQTFPDNSPEFVDSMNTCLSYSTRNGVKILAPLVDYDKMDIIEQALKSEAPLEWSWSCYHGGELPCGVCESCMRRKHAFDELGIDDPLLVRLGMVDED